MTERRVTSVFNHAQALILLLTAALVIQIKAEQAYKLMEIAYKKGVTLFDCAEGYAKGAYQASYMCTAPLL